MQKLSVIIISVILFSSSFGILNNPVYAIGYDAPINVSNTGDVVYSRVVDSIPRMTVSGNNVYAVWDDNSSGNSEIYLAKSTDAGMTFGSPINISNSAGNSVRSQISISGNIIYIVWDERPPSTSQDHVFISRSLDDGSTFSTPIKLDNANAAVFPRVSSSGSNVFVVWTGSPPLGSPSGLGSEVSIAISTDYGVTFGAPIDLSNAPDSSTRPQIVANGNNIHVAWADYSPGDADIFIRTSTDSGSTFGPAVNISNNSGGSGWLPVTLPVLIASGNNIYVTWTDDTPGNSDTFFAKSTDNGNTFSTPINVSNDFGDVFYPKMTINGNNILISWHGFISGTTRNAVFYSLSTDLGDTFGAPINISQNAFGSALDSYMVSSGDDVYIAWDASATATQGINIVQSTDKGITFGPAQNISSGIGSSGSITTQLATLGNNVLILWHAYTPTGSDVYFAKSNNLPPPITDSDGDGVADVDDNCPDTPNADQSDQNNNGIGDACDNVTPICADMTDAGNLWPPNHKMKSIDVSLDATDADGDSLFFTILSVFQDEPVNDSGDGNTSPDAEIIDNNTVELRAERSGNENGRVYHITIEASDGELSCTGVITVGVPHDKKNTPVDDGALFDSTQ